MDENLKKLNDALFQISQEKAQFDNIQGLPGVNRLAPKSYGMNEFLTEQAQHDVDFSRSIFGDESNIGQEYLQAANGNPSSYDEGITELNQMRDLNAFRANEQSGFLKATNAIVSGAISGLATALEDIGYILDLEGHYNTWNKLDNDRDNWLSKAMRQFKEGLNEAMPIYETESDSALGQFFKFSTLKGMIDSVVGFAIPGGLASKGIGAAVKLSRVGSLAARGLAKLNASAGTKVLANSLGEIAKDVTAGAITNYAEGQMMAIELGENAKQHYIESKAQEYYEQYKDAPIPLSIENARKLAEDEFNNDTEVQARIGKEQAEFVRNNRIFMLTDAIGLHGLVKSKGAFRQALLTNPKEKLKAIKNLGKLSADNILIQGAKEGAEEIGQNILQMEGEYQVRKAAGTLTEEDEKLRDTFWDRALAFSTSKQAIVEGLMGAVTGPGQRAVSRVVANVASGDILGRKRREEEYQSYVKQQEFIKGINNKLNNIVQAEALKAEAISRGDDVTADAMWNKEAADLITESIQNGTITALERSTEDIINDTSRTPEEREQAQKLKEYINESENEYILASHNPNSQEIFDNRIRHNTLQTWSKDLYRDIQNKLTDLNESLSAKSPVYNVSLDKDLNFEANAKTLAQSEAPEAYKTLTDRIKQYRDVKKALDDVDKEYKEITKKEYQEKWLETEVERLQRIATEAEKQAVESKVNKPLVQYDDNNQPILTNRAQVVKDGDNYFLRGYDDELGTYSMPLLEENGVERPVNSADLESYREENVEPVETTEAAEPTPATPEVKFFTPAERKELRKEVDELKSLDDLAIWRERYKNDSTLSEEAIEEIDDLYHRAQDRIIKASREEIKDANPENNDAQEIEFVRSDSFDTPEANDALWDPPKRSAENYWRGSKGSDIASRENGNVDQIRWFDFLDKHDASQYRGIIVPFKYEGKTAGRLILTDHEGNYIDADGNSIGKEFDPNRAIYTTVADPTTNADGKYYGTQKDFDYYRAIYIRDVWEHLQDGVSVPVVIQGTSAGIIDDKYKDDVIKKPAQLKPLAESLPANMDINTLTVYISNTGRIITENGQTFTVPAGTMAIHDATNNNFYRANSVPIQAETRQFLVDLFRHYIAKSIKRKTFVSNSKYTFRSGKEFIHYDFFGVLRDLLRYNSHGDPARTLYNIKNENGQNTVRWNIGDKEIDAAVRDENGNYVINEAFLTEVNNFLSKAFYNPRYSKINPASKDPYYFPTKINKDGTLGAKKYQNYHTFVRENLVDFVVDPNSPYAHAERYVTYDPLNVETVTSDEASEAKEEVSKEKSLASVIDTIRSGTPVKMTLEVTNPANGNINRFDFEAQYDGRSIVSSDQEHAFPIVVADQLNQYAGREGATLADVANAAQAYLANRMGVKDPTQFNAKLTFVEDKKSPVSEPTTLSSNPAIAALQRQLESTTDPKTRAQLQRALDMANNLNATPQKSNDNVHISTVTKFRRTYEQMSNSANEELDKAGEWFKKKFPDIDFKIVKSAIAKNVVGKFEDSVVTVYQGTGAESVYHEAFHVILDCLLTADEKANLVREALNNDEYKSNFDSLKPLYPELGSEELAEEVLAEAFADFMVTEDEDNNFIKKIFKYIKYQLTRLYNSIRHLGKSNREWTQSIQSIVERVRNKDFLTNDYLTLKATSPHYKVIPGLDAITTADAVNSLHYWFLQYFKENGNLIDILQSENAKIVSEAYEFAHNEFVGRYNEILSSIAFADPNLMEQYLSDLEKLQKVLETWNDPKGIKALHQQERLAQYKLELNTSEDYQESASEISGGENNQGRDSAALFAESITVSSKMNSNKIIKLLLSTLPKKYYDFKTREAIPYKNSLGMPEVEPFGKVFNILANKLANLPTSISMQELQKRLSQVAEEYPAIYPLIRDEVVSLRTSEGEIITQVVPSWLKLDKVDSWSASDMLQVVQFMQAFNNNKNNYLIGITKANGQYTIFNASTVGHRARIAGAWRAQLSKWLLEGNPDIIKFYSRNKYKVWQYNADAIKKAFPRIPTADNAEEFLRILGITYDINNPETLQKALHTKRFLDKIGQVYYQILKGSLKTPIVNENRDGENENLDAFLDIQSDLGIETLENSHISLGDERIYDLQKPGYINQTINKINRVIDSPEKLYSEMPHLDPSHNIYVTHSLLLNRALVDRRTPKLSILIHEGNRENSNGTGTDYKDMKLIDKLSTVLNMTMEGRDNIMRPADNGQERFLDHGDTWINVNTTRGEVIDIFRGYLWDEIARSHIKDRAFTNFNKNYTKGTVIESLLTPNEIKEFLVDTAESPNNFADRVLNTIGRDVLSTRIERMINTWTSNAYDKLIDLGGLKELAKDQVLNMSLKLSTNPTTNQYSKSNVISWIRHAVVNYAIGNIEQSKILYGDNIFYKSLGDEFKRHNGAMGSKKTCLTSDGINTTIARDFKRMDGAENLTDESGKPILRTAVFSDVPSYSKQLYQIAEIVDAENNKYKALRNDVLKAYEHSDKSKSFEDMMTEALIKNADKLGLNSAPYADMTEGDGFGMISLDAYREFKVRVGDWNLDSEKLYQWEVQERAGVPVEERVFVDFDGHKSPLTRGSWGSQVFNSLKPQHFGPLANVEGFKPSFYKLSLMPLIPSVLKALGDTNLSKLHELMIKNQVSVAVHYSANKGVTTKTNSVTNEEGVLVTNTEHPFNDFYDKEGNFLVDTEGNYTGPLDLLTQDTYWEYWGIQVDTGEHKHHDVVTGTQMMVQILNGLFDAGEISEHFGENTPKVKALAEEYISLNNQRIAIGRDQLVKELGLVATKKGWKISKEGIVSLVNSLRREAIERGLADNYITAIELLDNLDDGTTNIDILPTREKIESILMSRAASMTTSQKRHGTAAFQVPSTMWETKASRTYNEGKYKSSDLDFVVKYVDGKPKITSMEVYLPSPFKGITKVGKVPPELLQLIGFRIPTQGLSSIETIVVKDFLPEAAGDIIVLPTEIVAKAGSDYDIDKMYLYVPNYYKVKGQLKYIDYSHWEEQYEELVNSFKDEKKEGILEALSGFFGNSELLQELADTEQTPKVSKEEFHKKAIENRITQIQKELAHIAENASNFIAPIQTNILEASAKRAMKAVFGDTYEMEAEYYKSKAALPSILDPTYVLQVAENYMAGKKEVGIAANAGKFYVFASMYNLGIPAEEVQINFEHNEENGVVQLGRKFTAGTKKIPISELLNQWISAAVDAAKSPFGVNLGATPATIGTLTMLTMAGVHPDTLALFMNQPIIREYLKLQQQYESQIAQENYVSPKSARVKAGTAMARYNKNEIRAYLSMKYPPIDEAAPAKVFTVDELESYITTQNLTYQNQILDDFIRYVEWGRNVADAMQGTTYDTKDGGKNLSELLMKLHKSLTAGEKIVNYEKLVDEGYIAGYKNAVAEYKDFFKPLFLLLRDEQFTNGQDGLFDDVISRYTASPTPDYKAVSSLNKFKNDFLTAIILNTPDANGTTLISERKRLMVGDNSVPMKLARLRSEPAYKDNPLFQALVPILDTVREDIHNIKPYVDKDPLASNAVTYAWEQLYLQDKEFAMDLMKFCLLQSGLQMSPLNYIDIIPASMYRDYIKPMLDSYQERGYGVMREAFLYAWQLSNYNDDSILPFNLRMALAFPLGKRYATDEDGNKTKKIYPIVRYYNEKKQDIEGSRINFPLDSQSVAKNHQRQIYNFEADSPLVKLINEIRKIKEVNLDSSDIERSQPNKPYTWEEVEIMREAQIEEEMANSAPEDFYSDQSSSPRFKYSLAMNFADGTGGRTMRSEFKGKTTMELVLSGDRTATSRDWGKSYNRMNLTEGDILRVTGSAGGELQEAFVEVTKAPYPVDSISKEEWSKLEGWSEAGYDRIKGKGYYQFQYKLLESFNNSTKSKGAEFIQSGEERKKLCK